jgi:hypothetical protein
MSASARLLTLGVIAALVAAARADDSKPLIERRGETVAFDYDASYSENGPHERAATLKGEVVCVTSRIVWVRWRATSTGKPQPADAALADALYPFRRAPAIEAPQATPAPAQGSTEGDIKLAGETWHVHREEARFGNTSVTAGGFQWRADPPGVAWATGGIVRLVGLFAKKPGAPPFALTLASVKRGSFGDGGTLPDLPHAYDPGCWVVTLLERRDDSGRVVATSAQRITYDAVFGTISTKVETFEGDVVDGEKLEVEGHALGRREVSTRSGTVLDMLIPQLDAVVQGTRTSVRATTEPLPDPINIGPAKVRVLPQSWTKPDPEHGTATVEALFAADPLEAALDGLPLHVRAGPVRSTTRWKGGSLEMRIVAWGAADPAGE